MFTELGGKGAGVVWSYITQINVVPLQHFTTCVVKLQLTRRIAV